MVALMFLFAGKLRIIKKIEIYFFESLRIGRTSEIENRILRGNFSFFRLDSFVLNRIDEFDLSKRVNFVHD